MKNAILMFAIAVMMMLTGCQCKTEDITIFLAGDSTMADKPYRDGNPEKGWGQIIPLYFKEGVRIENHARNGRSTKTFIDEGRWDSLLVRVKEGDYVIIEFGHNDSKIKSPVRYAEANTDYSDNLRRFITDVRGKEATPILATPIVRRSFEEGVLIETHGDYPDAVRNVAHEMDVILFDLHEGTRELVSRFGEQLSKNIYLHIDSVEYLNMSKNKEDNTHLSPYGAFLVCDLVKREIENKVPELAGYLKK
ncbi:MAG TPA: rhamnogalacturonan acetylesterase [Marinilabiliaceae bacterium]|nr:rhamnogalacturonan acetylesterase [Marinilabiliaceae bacterium]